MNSSLQSLSSLGSLPSLTYDQLKSHSSSNNSGQDCRSLQPSSTSFPQSSTAFASSCNSFAQTSNFFLLQPGLGESSQTNADNKRLRDSLPVSSNKKGKTSFGPITKLATELFDSDSNKILGFRCFRECEILGNQLEKQELIQSEVDDDVSSEAEDIINGIEFLLEELESVLISSESYC